MLMKQISPSDRRSIVHPRRLGYEIQVPSIDPSSGKMYLKDFEPINQEENISSMYELDACLKSGRNLDSVEPIDLNSFDQRLAVVESTLYKLSSKKAVVTTNVEPSKSE